MSSEPEEVFMYEATGGQGVHMSRFSTKKVYIGNYYKKCVLRRLTWPDKDENVPNLLTFCKQTEGHEYSVMSKLSRKTSVVKTSSTQSTIDEDRTFFCSELIAKCFKECNISPQTTTHCSTVNPGHFSSQESNPFPLVENAKLGPEMLIVTETMLNDQQAAILQNRQ